MAENKSNDWRSSASKKRIKGLIAAELLQLFEIHSETRVAVHVTNIQRSKGRSTGTNPDGTPKFRDPYYVEDEEFLKDLQAYRAELEDKITEDDD